MQVGFHPFEGIIMRVDSTLNTAGPLLALA